MRRDLVRKKIEQLEAEKRRSSSRSKANPTNQNADTLMKVSDVLRWLQSHTKTHDPHWRDDGAKSPYRPFPDKPYFRPILDALKREDVVFCVKSRDLMMSWLCVAYLTHDAMTHPGIQVLVQSQTEEKAAELINYAKILYAEQDPDIREMYPLSVPLGQQSQLELCFANGSRILGIPHGADKIRSYHPTALFIDEAAFVADAGQSYEQAIAACKKIVVLSSAGPGWFEQVVASAEDRVKHLATGVLEKRTPQGVCVLSVHYTADPERRDPEWKKRERPKYTTESAWQAEQEMQFSAGGGERIFAEVLARDAERIFIDPYTSGFEPSPDWPLIAGFDFGKANPTAVLIASIDYDGVIYVKSEFYQPGLSPREIVPLLRRLNGFSRAIAYADPSIFHATHVQSNGRYTSVAALLAGLGIDNLIPAPRNQELGGMEAILDHWTNREPTLKIVCPRELWDISKPIYGVHNYGCPNLLWELRQARRAELTPLQLMSQNRPEKIIGKNNHLRDCLKYMVLANPGPPEKSDLQLKREGIRAKVDRGDYQGAFLETMANPDVIFGSEEYDTGVVNEDVLRLRHRRNWRML